MNQLKLKTTLVAKKIESRCTLQILPFENQRSTKWSTIKAMRMHSIEFESVESLYTQCEGSNFKLNNKIMQSQRVENFTLFRFAL